MRTADACIYCGQVDPTWAKAHVVPRLMGAFKNQRTLLRQVCTECDRQIGECEAVLAKCSMEAVVLKHIGIVGRHRQGSSPFRRGHSGLPPICMKTMVPGYEHEVRTEPIGDSNDVGIIPQLILFDKSGKREDIVIENGDCINPREWEVLCRKFAEGRVKDLDAIGLAPSQVDRIVQHLHTLGASFDLPESPVIPAFQGTANGRGTVLYDGRYFRGLAKIAFHYFLLHSSIFRGSEPEFDRIRRFIRYGEGDERDLFLKGNGPIAYDPSGMDRPPFYGHVLRTDSTSPGIAVCILLFIGRDYKPDWYKVVLSRNEPRMREEFGHYYKYFDHPKGKQYDGTIEELRMLHLPSRLQAGAGAGSTLDT